MHLSGNAGEQDATCIATLQLPPLSPCHIAQRVEGQWLLS